MHIQGEKKHTLETDFLISFLIPILDISAHLFHLVHTYGALFRSGKAIDFEPFLKGVPSSCVRTQKTLRRAHFLSIRDVING